MIGCPTHGLNGSEQRVNPWRGAEFAEEGVGGAAGFRFVVGDFGDFGEARESGFAAGGGAVFVAELGEVFEGAQCPGRAGVIEECGERSEIEFELRGDLGDEEIGIKHELEGAVDEFDGGWVGCVGGGGVLVVLGLVWLHETLPSVVGWRVTFARAGTVSGYAVDWRKGAVGGGE